MKGIDEWLALHGLSEYATLFREHRIGLDNLPAIDEADLRELGVPLGDRKRILKAVSRMAGDAAEASSPSAQSAPSERRERRLLVVLFCDLVGSTEYASHLDPEDLRILLHGYRSRVKEIIEKHRGLTMIYEGDGIKAYFGSQVASEDDQENALSAALQIRDEVSKMQSHDTRRLSVRLGVATGTVIVDDFDSPTGPHAFGKTMHLAARLQALADPNTILVDEATARSMGGVFELEDTGRHRLKGFDAPIRVHRLGEKKKAVRSRFAKRFRNTLLVGRERELGALMACWNRVRDRGEGAVAELSGESGIGKSRLAHELERYARGEDARVMLFQCSPIHTESVYYPVLDTLGADLGLTGDIDEHEKFDRLKSFLGRREVPIEHSLRVFANLFSLGRGDEFRSQLGESKQEEIAWEVLTDYVLEHTDRRATLVLLEDAQWIDESTSRFFHHLARFCRSRPLLLLWTSRGAGGRAPESAMRISLDRLTADQSRKLLHEICARRVLPAEFRRYIERKAEGVPLFIEELASTMFDMGIEHYDPEALVDAEEGFEMSGVLQSSLLSRLDRLGKSKEVAELAATVGREFGMALLQAVSGIDRDELEQALERLVDAEIVFRKSAGPDGVYEFRHALIQDTARRLPSRERRALMHRKIASVLAQWPRAAVNAEPELVAHHFNQGGEYAQAAEYWLAAGRKTGKTWAKKEALKLLYKGREALFRTPPSTARVRSELDFQLEIGDVLYATYGYITDEAEEAYQHSLELAGELGDHEASIRALDGLFGIHFNSCDFSYTLDVSDRLIGLGESQGAIAALVLGRQFKGMSLFCLGRFEEADALLAAALEHLERADEVGSDFPSMALIYQSWCKYIRGLPEAAVHAYEQARLIVRVQEPYRKAACLGNGCILFAMMNEVERVRALTGELIPLSAKYGLNLWLNIGMFFRGWSASRGGDVDGVREMEAMIDKLGNQEIDKTLYLLLLAGAYLEAGRLGDAASTIDGGLAQVQRTGERYVETELVRLKAVVTRLTGGDVDEARALLRQAIECATAQAAGSWAARAQADLSSLSPQGTDRQES